MNRDTIHTHTHTHTHTHPHTHTHIIKTKERRGSSPPSTLYGGKKKIWQNRKITLVVSAIPALCTSREGGESKRENKKQRDNCGKFRKFGIAV